MYFELFASLTAISLVSLIGVFTLKIKEQKLENFLELMVAFAVGALLGDVFIHLLPELSEKGFSLDISLAILSGVVVFFILEKVVHWHHCHHAHHGKKYHTFTYMSLAGDLLHNAIDGIILAGAFLASPVIGFSTAIAIVLHEIPQEIADFGVLLKGGFSKKKALAFNFITALSAFVGAIFALILGSSINGITPLLIAFAAGSFLYIAGTDLLPQLHDQESFTTRKALMQVIFLLAGMLVMAALLLVG
ncbi:MAG: ZIP family metal transporter [archaeon]